MSAMNIGNFDRGLRILVGLALIGWALGFVPGSSSAWGWLGVIPLATALMGFCPAYTLLGMSTRGHKA